MAAESDGNFDVFLRLRPSASQTTSRFLTASPDGSHVFVEPPESSGRRTIESFSFTRVFDEATGQLQVFDATALPLLRDVLQSRRDGLLAALGVSGSGKTHTIFGSRSESGLTQLALQTLYCSLGNQLVNISADELTESDRSESVVIRYSDFLQLMQSFPKRASAAQKGIPDIVIPDTNIEVDSSSKYAIVISMWELYNDRIFDLLDGGLTDTERRRPLLFRKIGAQGAREFSKEQRRHVCGLRKVKASSVTEALQILDFGRASRRASSTNSNATSSRSHAFLQIEIKRYSSRGNEKETTSLQVVDLAGSERARDAKTVGNRLTEAGSINRSLMTLGQCLQLLSVPGKSASAPWRQSKLTEILFSNSFTGASRYRIIATANASGEFNSTCQILRYSALAREITISRSPDRNSSASKDEPQTILAEKDALIASLMGKLEDTENKLCEAENKCLDIEMVVREELCDEMERRLDAFVRDQKAARMREDQWRDEFVDGKIDILARALTRTEIADIPKPSSLAELEAENRALKQDVAALKREIQLRDDPNAKLRCCDPLCEVVNLDNGH